MNDQSVSTRRDFLKTSTAAAIGGVIAAPAMLGPRSSAAEAGDVIKVGLIGCGGRGTGAASQALHADRNVVLTAVGDVFEGQCQQCVNGLRTPPKERQAASDQPGLTIHDRVRVTPETTFVGLDAYQKVIDSGVDVVLLAAPPGFRPQHFKAAVAAGKHVFAEKPVATDAPGVRSILETVEVAKQKKLAVVSGYCWRAELGRREFFKRIHDGAIGEVRAIYATYLTGPVKAMPPASERREGISDVEWQLRNWYNFTWLSGDGLVEQACHSIDKVAWAMNGVLPLKAVGNGGREIPNHQGNIFDHMDIFYEFPNGVRAFMAQRQISNCYSDNSDYLMCAEGTGTIKGWSAPIIQGKEAWRYRGPKNDMYQTEHDELFASIRKGEPINHGVWMAHSTLMAIMGRMSAYTGQEVTWEQALNSQEKLVPDNLTWNMELPIRPLAVPGRTKLV
jgi:myo-inositol 2-dehydrogenase / D-chiro-inositol 1-dehydrogenase